MSAVDTKQNSIDAVGSEADASTKAERDAAYEAHRLDQVRHWASRTPAERMEWLWQAKLWAAANVGRVRR